MQKFWILTFFLVFFIKSSLSQNYITRKPTFPQNINSAENEAKKCEKKSFKNSTEGKEEEVIFKFDKQRSQCGILGTKGHCPHNMQFFYDDGPYGYCDCKDLNTDLGGLHLADLSSKLVYHPITDQCYFIFSQGPCPLNKVVAFDKKTKKLICEHNPCQEFPPGSFYFNGYCYKEHAKCDIYPQDVLKFVKGYKYPLCIVDDWINYLNPISPNLNKYDKNCYSIFKDVDKNIKFEEGFEDYHSPHKMLCRATLKIKESEFYNSRGTPINERKLVSECVAKNSQNAENTKYRYDNGRNKCGKVGERSHCPNNMVFLEKGWEDKYEGLGYCECKQMELKNVKELDYSTRFVYDQQTDQCYKIFSKESCLKNHWVSVEPQTGFKKCIFNPCHNTPDMFLYDGKCYKIGESCGDIEYPNGFKVYRNMIFLKHYLYPHCFTSGIVSPVGSVDSAKASNFKKKCAEGSYLNIKNECQPGFDF